jgi:hypothetical protein
MQSLLWRSADRRTVGIRRGCHASRQVYSEVGESIQAHVKRTPPRMSQTKSKRLISDFRESIFPMGPHHRVETALMRQLGRFQRGTIVLPPGPPCGMPDDWAPTRTMGSANGSSKPRFPSALSQSPTIPSSRFAGGTSAAASRQERNRQTTKSVTHVLAQSVTHVLTRFPPRPSPR